MSNGLTDKVNPAGYRRVQDAVGPVCAFLHSKNRLAVPLLAALLSVTGCATLGAAEQQAIDCKLPHTDTRIDKCTLLRNASEFNGCLRASDLVAHTCILMDSDLQICDGEPPLSISALFDRSNKTLDCAGGTIDHGWHARSVVTGEHKTAAARQMPFVRFNDDRSLDNITIKNCTMRGTLHAAIQATRFFGGELGGNGILDADEPIPVGHDNILFEDLKIEGGEVGIYLGNYSRDIHMNRIHIDGTRRIALYSEAGSQRVRLTDSTISNNRTREAVAIDSTYDSEISNTLFINNREGGINLYHNCGELKGSVCPVVRSTPSDGNIIRGNRFINNGITGVQIASRQGRNHTLGWCASLNGLPGKFTDKSRDNLVENNHFECHGGTALIVMNGPNSVRNNTIKARGSCVPYEISTGGHGASASDLLQGVEFDNNTVDAQRPARLRNLPAGLKLQR